MAKCGAKHEQAPEPRTGMPDVHLDEAAFRERFLTQFADPALRRMRRIARPDRGHRLSQL